MHQSGIFCLNINNSCTIRPQTHACGQRSDLSSNTLCFCSSVRLKSRKQSWTRLQSWSVFNPTGFTSQQSPKSPNLGFVCRPMCLFGKHASLFVTGLLCCQGWKRSLFSVLNADAACSTSTLYLICLSVMFLLLKSLKMTTDTHNSFCAAKITKANKAKASSTCIHHIQPTIFYRQCNRIITAHLAINFNFFALHFILFIFFFCILFYYLFLILHLHFNLAFYFLAFLILLS